MSICKDCVHFEACVSFWYSDYDCDCSSFEESKEKHANSKTCDYFKPTADVVEVRHGEWVSNELCGYKYAFYCSECGWVDGYPFNDRHKYCPNCGAKMDGERSENGT